MRPYLAAAAMGTALPRNAAELSKILDDVSDPASVSYGKHMTREEILYQST